METAQLNPATVRTIVDTIDRVTSYEEPLRRRTEGATWMVWGLVLPAIALSYHAVPALAGDEPPLESPLYYLLWAPWAAAGALATYGIWRIAGVAAPGLDVTLRQHALASLAWMLVAGLAWTGAWVVSPHMLPDTSLSLALGTTWLLFGALGLFRLSQSGRRVCLAIGVVLLLAGLAMALLQPSDPRAAEVHATISFVAVSSLAPLAGGLWQVVRG